MAIRIVSNICIADEDIPAYLEWWRERSKVCRAERGNLQYEVFRSIEHPNQFALLEAWEDQETYDEHWEAQQQLDRPTFARAPRTTGRDGLEFYHDLQYYRLVDGQWVPAED